MDISSDLIFYQIQKLFPDSVHHMSKNYRIRRPMFWGTGEAMKGHLVVLGPSEMIHIVHHFEDTVFLCSGYDPVQLKQCRSECIGIPQEIPLPRLFNKILELFDRLYQWEDTLDSAVNQSYSFDTIIRSCDDFLEDPMALLDSCFRYVSYSRRLAFENRFEERYVGEQQYMPLEDINQLTSMPDFKNLEKKHDIFEYVCVESCLHANIFYKDKYVGRLALPNTDNPAKKAYYTQILRIVASYTETLYSRFGTFWHRKSSDTRLKKLLIRLLAGYSVEQDSLSALFLDRGFNVSDHYCLIRFHSQLDQNPLETGDIMSIHLENNWPGSVCFFHEENLLVLVNLDIFSEATGKAFNQELALFLRESLLTAGISRTFTNILWISAAYRQTGIALELGRQINPMYWYFKFDDYAFSYLLQHGYNHFLPEQVCDPVISLLNEYDLKNSTELNTTLRTFIREQYNAASTARVLCIARSSFLKRMERIQVLTKLNLDDPGRRIYLALSYQIYEQFHQLHTEAQP